MKIVVLDGFTMNPGDLSWDGLRSLGEVVVHDRTKPEEVVARCRGAAVVLTNKVALGREQLEALPELKFIAVTATGYNIVDVVAALDRGVVVSNVPEYSTDAVAQFVFALILDHCSRVAMHAAAVAAGEWERCADFSFSKRPLTEVSGKTLGIVGIGRIGMRVAEIGRAFGMRVVATSRSEKKVEGVEFVSLEELVGRSDFVSLHCPLTEATKGIVNAELLKKFKKGAVLVNTSRGGLLVEKDVAEALKVGTLAALLADVVSVEPIRKENPLGSAPRATLTPHNAWAAVEARRRLMETTVKNVRAFLAGSPVNVVS